MDDPIIAVMERTGKNPAWFYGAGECEMKYIGECALCGADIYNKYTYVTDKDGNVFCDREDAMDFYGIREVL